MAKLSPDFVDWPYLGRIFDKLPESFAPAVSDSYRNRYRKHGQQAANLWAGTVSETVTAKGYSLAASDKEICAAAVLAAKNVQGILADTVGGTAEALLSSLQRYAEGQGVTLPEKVELRGVIGRLTDSAWWRRQFRRTAGRKIEGFARKMGLVQRKAGIYASDETVSRHAEQKRRNLAALEQTEASREAVNTQTGEIYEQTFTLAELAALGVSNPSVRFAELMVRVRGMESHAIGVGDIGLFVTGTVPSRMHAIHAETGRQNRLFDDAAPREAQQWISRQWARIRAALARLGVKYYGVRVAEPHHDGTPHWHMLVFIRPELSAGRSAVSRFMAVFRRFMLRGDWKGSTQKELRAAGLSVRAAQQAAHAERVEQRAAEKADKNRRRRACDFKLIDRERGSAAGYLVKYLAKNISGERMGQDDECGKLATETAGRVLAWASCWGIRQFQVIGGPPVGVWRELRRIKEKPEQGELFAAWEATGSKAEERAPDWGEYIAAQGGIEIKRADRPVQPWRLQEPGRLTKYHDEAPARVAGVVCAGVATRTRDCVWTIRRNQSGTGSIRSNAFGGLHRGQVVGLPGVHGGSRGKLRTHGGRIGEQAGQAVGPLGFSSRIAAPRTRVNNCTSETPGPWPGLARNMAGWKQEGRNDLVLQIFNEVRRLKNGD